VKRLSFTVLGILFQVLTHSYGNTLDSLLTADEIEWLKKNSHNIRFAPDPEWMPVDYVDSEGVHRGIVAELIGIIENKLGLTFNKLYYNPWSEALKAIENGKVDFLGSVQKTAKRDEFLNFTDPYISIPLVILVGNNHDLTLKANQINKMRLAAVRGYAYLDFVKSNYPEVEIIEYDDHLTTLIQTSLGNTDGVIIDLMTASALVEKYNITNLSIGASLDYTYELRFAINKDLPELSSILQKALADISGTQKHEIIGKWVHLEILISETKYPEIYKYLSYAVIILFFITIIIILINYSLKKKVAERTKELQCEIKEKEIALDRAKESDRLKTAFLNNLSHEIRTPMNGILGFSTLMRGKDLSADQIERYTTIIDCSANQLLNIVDDILEMAHIDSGQTKVKKGSSDLHSILNSLYDQFKNETDKKGIEFKLSTPAHSIMHLNTDKTKLNQIISNLLVNAIKFTEFGRIQFGYECSGEFLKFFVKDTGIGVPEDMKERVFDRFFKVDNSDNQLYSGNGLGLSISKGLVELLGGRIWFESNSDRESVFYFTIPVM
jgi:signal transduction histidine kinase/ABC-type amino acid transport substrate-binding protein